jgi:hypothetical protein
MREKKKRKKKKQKIPAPTKTDQTQLNPTKPAAPFFWVSEEDRRRAFLFSFLFLPATCPFGIFRRKQLWSGHDIAISFVMIIDSSDVHHNRFFSQAWYCVALEMIVLGGWEISDGNPVWGIPLLSPLTLSTNEHAHDLQKRNEKSGRERSFQALFTGKAPQLT